MTHIPSAWGETKSSIEILYGEQRQFVVFKRNSRKSRITKLQFNAGYLQNTKNKVCVFKKLAWLLQSDIPGRLKTHHALHEEIRLD